MLEWNLPYLLKFLEVYLPIVYTCIHTHTHTQAHTHTHTPHTHHTHTTHTHTHTYHTHTTHTYHTHTTHTHHTHKHTHTQAHTHTPHTHHTHHTHTQAHTHTPRVTHTTHTHTHTSTHTHTTHTTHTHTTCHTHHTHTHHVSHTPRVTHTYVSHCTCATQLEEIWVESVSEASDKQLAEETVPGKPMSVFLAEPPKVVYMYVCVHMSHYTQCTHIRTYVALASHPTLLSPTLQPPISLPSFTLQLPLSFPPSQHPFSPIPQPPLSPHPSTSTLPPISLGIHSSLTSSLSLHPPLILPHPSLCWILSALSPSSIDCLHRPSPQLSGGVTLLLSLPYSLRGRHGRATANTAQEGGQHDR